MRVLFLFLLFFAIVGCNTNKSTSQAKTESNSKLEFAEHFELIEVSGDYLLHLLSPETGDIVGKYYLTKNPNRNLDDYQQIVCPTTKIIPLSSTSIGMLSILNKTKNIVGISNHNYINEPSLIDRFNKNELIECGDESMIPIEKIVSVHPDLIFYSGFGDNFPAEKQLNKLGIYTLPIYDWREKHPLGKAEWIKLFGVLTDQFDIAEQYFDKIKSTYLNLVEKSMTIKERPSVLCGNLIGDIWFAPNGESYVAKLLKDAGGDYVYKSTSGTGSIELSFEQVLFDNQNTQIWLNPGFPSFEQIFELNSKSKYLNPVKNDNVYCYSHEMNRFWERSAIEPHHLLKDLMIILHPNYFKNDSLYFYRKVVHS